MISQLLMLTINNICCVCNCPQQPRQVLSRKPTCPTALIAPCCTIVKSTQHQPDCSTSKKIDQILSNMDDDIVHIQNISADGGSVHRGKREQSLLVITSDLFNTRGVQFIFTSENEIKMLRTRF